MTTSKRRPRAAEPLAILAPYAGRLDAESFARLRTSFHSAEAMTRSLLAGRGEPEWRVVEPIWEALIEIGERWTPEEPFVESIARRLERGSDAESAAERCEIWLGAWTIVRRLADRFEAASLGALDDALDIRLHLSEWADDLDAELGNAIEEDERFLAERFRYVEEILDRFPREDAITAGNYRRSLAECHFAAGRPETADALYREWLEADPRWGWGWLGWAGAYGLFTRRSPDYARAEEILRRALEVEGLDPREAVLDHLAEVLKETGRGAEARLVQRERKELLRRRPRRPATEGGAGVLRITQAFDFGEEGLPLESLKDLQAVLRGQAPAGPAPRVGRNEPCPCGSGRKYKKCCGVPGAGTAGGSD